MNIQECYQTIGGEYDNIFSRLKNDDKIERFLKLFLNENCYTDLEEALATENIEEAFRAAHTLKGVCQNMAFVKLYQSASVVTEYLREKNMVSAKTNFPAVQNDYMLTVKTIQEYLNQ